jgi:hypothetical protein
LSLQFSILERSLPKEGNNPFHTIPDFAIPVIKEEKDHGETVVVQ